MLRRPALVHALGLATLSTLLDGLLLRGLAALVRDVSVRYLPHHMLGRRARNKRPQRARSQPDPELLAAASIRLR